MKLLAVTGIILYAGCAAHADRGASDPLSEQAGPNVLHIVVDDLGVMDVGFMGDTRYKTPNIDRLASQGMAFTEGYLVAQVGKWHIGKDPTTQGVAINVAGGHNGGPGTYFSPYQVEPLENGPRGEYLTDRLTTEVIKIMEAHKEEKFFLYFPFYTVHTPIMGKPELIAILDAWRKKNNAPIPSEPNPQYRP